MDDAPTDGVAERNWLPAPEQVTFNITSRCNLRCQYCFGGMRARGTEASLGEAISVLDQLDSLGVEEVLLQGGEVFCVPYMRKLLERASSYRFHLHVISNGTLISERLAQALSGLKLSIGISLDGLTPEVNRHRGAEALEKAVGAIHRLVSQRMITYVNCTVTRSNVSALPQLVSFCDSAGVHGLVLQQLHCSGRATAHFFAENTIGQADTEALESMLLVLKETYPRLRFVESEICYFLGARTRYNRVCDPGLEYLPMKLLRCAAGRRYCAIEPNLDVIPCVVLGSFPCGNLRQESFRAVWGTSPGLEFMRELSESRVDRIPGCLECTYNPVCDGGCRADMLNYCDDWLAAHILCPFNAANSQRQGDP